MTASWASAPADSGKRAILERLRGRQPLFAVLDAARDARILALLRPSTAISQSLYEGDKAVELAGYAPYLVELPADSALLPALVEQGWGQSWGVYLSSREPFAQARSQLRRYLMVKQPDGRIVYFRFYDPRVLRTFLPGLNAPERADFFGPIDCFLLEADSTEVQSAPLLEFTSVSSD